ncbi:MAG: AAA family ATPase [Oscillospiraceae bacterium]|nr:AAA family ATPase [Oscillospiraceae bacterium]
MKLRKLTATFGALENETLQLADGLNIITAPNEKGKSTWCAFLRTMLYGFPTRARGLQSDKNRYLPWSGSAMTGQMELQRGEESITLTRRTARANSPMGAFSAVYTGTADEVAGITAADCGETLLGVSREVYQRSAFIRQGGLVIDQDAELERRISALITTGKAEDYSYSETNELLKKQLNRRRHNKTGLIPNLDRRLEEIAAGREHMERLQTQFISAQALVETLAAEEAELTAELELHRRYAAAQKRRAALAAQAEAEDAARAEEALRRRLEEEGVPDNETIARLRAAIVNLETARKNEAAQRAARDEAALALVDAEKAVNESPFAGESAESAKEKAKAVPYRFAGRDLGISAAAGLAVFAAVAALFILNWKAMALGLMLGAASAAAAVLLLWAVFRHTYINKERENRRKRFGTEETGAVEGLAENYGLLLAARDTRKEAATSENAKLEALHTAVTTAEQGILLEIRRFAPAAFDTAEADSILRQCASRRKALAEVSQRSQNARLRAQLLSQEDDGAETEETPLPERTQEETQQLLTRARSRLAESQSAVHRLQGEMKSLGSLSSLAAEEKELTEERERLQKEYDAVAMAIDALAAANTTLQNRFSPALGQRASEIFTRLTGGRYEKVFLNRAMEASAQEANGPVPHESALLSAGTVDELYLAVRLAIAEMTLPKDDPAPLVLDDALVNFDDSRMASALEYLAETAKERQILLFTCHTRESEYMAGRQGVNLISL